MAHRYGHPISVALAPNGLPASFLWRDCYYPISEVFATWHLMDRWWACPQPGGTFSIHEHAQDRTYYRVCCRGPAGEQLFDLYYDAVTNLWALDIAHD